MINQMAARMAIARLIPGAETITLHVRAAGDTASYTAYTINRARSVRPAYTESTLNGSSVPASTLPTTQWKIQRQYLTRNGTTAPDPRPGDVVEHSDGTLWMISQVGYMLFDEAMTLDCQQWQGSVT